jgi:cyclopropane-fatty-acyl-phospholipid synthase
MNRLVDAYMKHVVQRGTLDVIWSSGRKTRYGDGSGRPIRLVFHDRSAERAIALMPDLAFGEAFTDGRLSLENGSVYALLNLITGHELTVHSGLLVWLVRGFRRRMRLVLERNSLRRARRNVAHHYDLDGRLYRLFLDSDLQYSCAYFEHPGTSLEDAQLAKKRHIAAKLALQPGQKVLDIGSGWGGLGLYLAKHAHVDVTGVTLSSEQHAVSNQRAAAEGLSDRVHFHLLDYRTLEGPFERIVSVGMFEHVGVPGYGESFDTCHRLLAEDGVALVHSIGRFGEPDAINPWVAKYIFPGAGVPSLSEVIAPIERVGLLQTDLEILRLHYAETLRHWRERFLARRAEAAEIYDETFCRMWEFYLASCELGFRNNYLMVFQLQLAKRQDTVPLTRDYIAEAEVHLRQRESGRERFRIAGE